MLKADAQDTAHRRRRMPPAVLAMAACSIGFLLASACGTMRATGRSAGERAAEGPLGAVALAAPFAIPAVLGAIAFLNRRELWLAAGIVSIVLAKTYVFLTFPFVVPGVLFLVAYVRAGRGSRGAWRTVLVAALPAVAAPAALAILVTAPTEMVCSAVAGGVTCGETSFLPAANARAIGVVVAGAAAAVVLAPSSREGA